MKISHQFNTGKVLRLFTCTLLIGMGNYYRASAQCGAQATITIEVQTDLYGDETTWELYDQNNSVLVAVSGIYDPLTYYTRTICVDPTHCYFFVIYDAFGDGMCCDYGNGYYHVYYNGALEGTGGMFATNQTVFNIGTGCSGSTGTPLVTDNDTYSPTQLVQDVLLGSCVEAFNVQYTGAHDMIGYFSNGAGIGMNDGILLTSGSTDIAPGPNTQSDATRDWLLAGDDDLDVAAGLLPGTSQDACALEFDFVSFNDTVTFRYIFASEEYPEYVCSPYNDAFAFLVTGTGYAPNTNIALIPGTSIAVAINSINNGSTGSILYPASNCTSLSNTGYYVNNTFGNVTEYDAYTTPLTATMVVVPCDTYHIKLVIADVGDGLYDSGVFLQAKTFSAGEGVNIAASDDLGSKNTYESCSDGRFTFTRDDTSTADPVVIYYTISGSAIEGTDYLTIPDSIVIPVGQNSASVYIHPVNDGIPEGAERVIISFPDQCACNSLKRDTIFIFDNLLLTASINGPTSMCLGQPVSLTANGVGSNSLPYSYSWSTGEMTKTISVNPLVQTTYTVTVTDRCGGQSSTASRTVSVANTTASFTVLSPQCFTQNDFDFTNTGNYTGSATFDWDLGNAVTRATEDVLNYSYATPGNYNVRLITSDLGCIDTAYQTVVLRDTFVTNINAFICPDSSVFAGGAFQNIGGTYFDFLTASNGCDSTVITTVTVMPYINSNLVEFICQGDSFFAGGAYQYTSGIYRDTISSLTTCDTIRVTNLVVNNNITISLNSLICPGDSFFAGSSYQSAAGVYRDTFPSANGCDSIVITNLIVADTFTTNISVSICPGDSVFAGGAWQKNPGSYYDSLSSASGCDSTIITTVSLLNAVVVPANASICETDSFYVGNGWQSIAGTYYDTFTNASGCDSVIATTLTIIDTSVTIVSVRICQGDSFFVGGNWQSIAGQYVDVLSSSSSCDSTIITDLAVDSIPHSQMSASICAGDSFLTGGAFQTLTGIYYDTLNAANGCDSIVQTNLLVLDTFLTNVSVFLCLGDSAFAEGAWQKLPGVYYDSLTSAQGCDSILATTILVGGSLNVPVNASICEGDSFLTGSGWKTVSGTYVDTFSASGGCDSIVTVVLIVNDTSITTVSAEICEGDSLFAGGNWQTVSGQYVDVLQSALGCDSTVITNLTVDTIIRVQVNAAICQGENYFVGGALQTTAGIYLDVYTSSTGCDSIVTINLVVSDTFLVNMVVYLCQGDSFFAGGAWHNRAGIFTDSLNSITGCDSVIVTNIVVQSVINVSLNTAICEGDSIFAEGAWQKNQGTFIDSFIASSGCDSIVITLLTVIDTIVTNTATTICEGDSFFVGGAWQKSPGQFIDLLQSTAGCDSTVYTNLFVDSIVFGNSITTICEGDSIFIGNSWKKSQGIYIDTLTASGGCDSVQTTNLFLNDVSVSGYDTTICAGDVAMLSVPGIYSSYSWTPGGNTTSSINASGGTYTLTVADTIGCSDTATFLVIESILSVHTNPADSARILRGNSVPITILGGNGQLNYSWSPSSELSCDTCSSAIATPYDGVIYTITVSDSIGCLSTTSIQIFVDTTPIPVIYVPNAFTPNDDGVNDEFTVYVRNYISYHLMIFDRWGEKLFESRDPLVGWNGTNRGKMCNPGVYVYYVNVKFENNLEPENYLNYQKGSLTLIR